jgi:hypothetical protein
MGGLPQDGLRIAGAPRKLIAADQTGARGAKKAPAWPGLKDFIRDGGRREPPEVTPLAGNIPAEADSENSEKRVVAGLLRRTALSS